MYASVTTFYVYIRVLFEWLMQVILGFDRRCERSASSSCSGGFGILLPFTNAILFSEVSASVSKQMFSSVP